MVEVNLAKLWRVSASNPYLPNASKVFLVQSQGGLCMARVIAAVILLQYVVSENI